MTRKIALLFIVVIALCWIDSSAQSSELDISGYYEYNMQIDYNDITEDRLINTSKIRLDFDTGGGDDMLRFIGNVNFLTYHGMSSFDMAPLLPEEVVNEMQYNGFETQFPLPQSRIWLDNAYLTWQNGPFRVRAGRQQLSWGSGYLFNPTDLFHKKDPIDPVYEKEGVNALRFDYRWGVGGQLTLVSVPGENFKESDYAVRLGTHISAIGYDVYATYHSITDSAAYSTYRTYFFESRLENLLQRRQAIGLELSGELLGLGVWVEGNYNIMAVHEDFESSRYFIGVNEPEDNFVRAVFGLDYTFDNGLYVMAEGLYNERAESSTYPYPTKDWMSSIYHGEPVGRAWWFAGISKDVGDLSQGSLYLYGGPDGSMALMPRLDTSVAQNADLSLYGFVTAGEEDGQFGSGIYSGFARVTVYF